MISSHIFIFLTIDLTKTYGQLLGMRFGSKDHKVRSILGSSKSDLSSNPPFSRGHGMPDYSSITQVLIVVNLGSNLKVSLGNRPYRLVKPG